MNYWDRFVSVILNSDPHIRTEAFKAYSTLTKVPEKHAWWIERAQECSFENPKWEYEDFFSNPNLGDKEENVRQFMDECQSSAHQFDTVEYLAGEITRESTGKKQLKYVYNGKRARDLAELPPPDSVVGGLLHRGHVTVLSAPPYSGKSWFSLNIATAVASVSQQRPAPWPGAVLDCPGTRVVYFSPDFPVSELARRARKLDEMRSDLVMADSYWDNLYLVGDAPGAIMPRERYCLDSDGADRIVNEVIPDEASLVILDTLSASLPLDVTENDNAGMARVMGNVQKIASQRDVAILLIHHTSKPTAGKGGSEVWSSVRGAGAISGSASSNALIEQLPDDEYPNIRRLRAVSNVSSAMPTTYFEVRPSYVKSDEILYFRPVPDPTVAPDPEDEDQSHPSIP